MAKIARWFLGWVVLACLLAGSGRAAAQPDTLFNIWHSAYLQVATEDNYKWSPAAAYDSQHDQYLVVWENLWPNGQHDIYGRRVTANGQLLAEFVVYADTVTGYMSKQPAVAYDSTHDRYLVVWSYDSAGDNKDYDILGRFIPWDGPNPAQGAFGIETSRASTTKPRVVYAVTPDEFMLVWKIEGDSSNNNISSIAGGLIFNNGNGVPVSISTDQMVDDFPDVAYNQARNEFLAVWDVDVSRTNYDLDIYAIRLAWDGVAQGPGEFEVTNSLSVEQHPSVAACSQANQYFIAWQQQVNLGPDDNIFGRFVAGDGTMDPIYGYAGTTLPQRYPRVTCNSEGTEYLLTWHDQYAQPLLRWGVWAEIIQTHGIVEPAFEVVRPSDDRDRLYPAVAYGRDSALFAWQHARDDVGWLDIWGQVVRLHTIFMPLVHH
jgi:hypothetical protein